MDKILLVDDVKMLREIQKGLLSSSPVQVLTAGDGREALAIIRTELPNLVVMDNHMPNMDGVTCCREIKADPLLRHIPVIMVTNAVKPLECEEYTAAGVDDWLSKPIDGKLFLSTLRRHLPTIDRRGTRVPLCAAVTVRDNDGVHAGRSQNIRLNGILITSGFHPSPGTEVRFEFVLPGSAAPTQVRGRVAWVKKNNAAGKSGPTADFGVEFIEITGEGMPFMRRSELAAYVARQTLGVATTTAAPA
jgi:two-component system, cell cycle response regulator